MTNCESCRKKCPQAEMAHEIAKGRMYATNEFVALLKKIEGGEMVEVVRCKDCMHCSNFNGGLRCDHPELDYDVECYDQWINVTTDDFCSYGERRKDG